MDVLGLLVRVESAVDYGFAQQTTDIRNSYDELGNIVQTTMTDAFGNVTTGDYENTCDENGNLIKSVMEYGSDSIYGSGTVTTTTEYVYVPQIPD